MAVWKKLLHLAFGVALIAAVGGGLKQLLETGQKQLLPPGWRLLRETGEVSALALQDDRLWAGGRDGLTLLDRTSGNIRDLPAAAPDIEHVYALCRDQDDGLWIGYAAGLIRFVTKEWRRYPELSAILPGPVRVMRRHGSSFQRSGHCGSDIRRSGQR